MKLSMTALSLRFNALLQHLGLRRTAATGLDWTPEIDAAFRADAWARAHYKLCLMFAGAAILFLAFWLWDFWREPVAATHTLTLRLIAAILCLAGLVNLPIVKFSVDWWSTLHQPATIAKFGKPSISWDMLWPLLVVWLGATLLFAALALLRTRAQILERERGQGWIPEVLR